MSTPDWPHLLTSLSSAAAKLNAASDDLNRVASAVEQRLVEANVGLEVWSPQTIASTESEVSADSGSTWVSQFVGFAKIDGQWCLAVKFTRFRDGFFEGDMYAPYQNTYAEQPPIALSKAPRDVRIAALEQLPKVVELLTEAATSRTEIIQKAKAYAT